ncbi:MAG: hypothetical protein Q8Q03_00085 [bacterium]|nr:hypothetical protein [bacterium]
MKSKRKSTESRKSTPGIDTSAAEFLAEGASKSVEPKPDELLRQWINFYTMTELGKELGTEHKQFMEDTDLQEIVDKMSESRIVSVIMDMAYGGNFRNPYSVADAIEYDNTIYHKLMGYFKNNRPEDWDLAFCELIAATNQWGYFYDHCDEWRSDREKARKTFKSFVGGEVSATMHSQRLYDFFYSLFFGSGCAASELIRSADLSDRDQALLMQGLIEKGKKGIFPWDFETFISS